MISEDGLLSMNRKKTMKMMLRFSLGRISRHCDTDVDSSEFRKDQAIVFLDSLQMLKWLPIRHSVYRLLGEQNTLFTVTLLLINTVDTTSLRAVFDLSVYHYNTVTQTAN